MLITCCFLSLLFIILLLFTVLKKYLFILGGLDSLDRWVLLIKIKEGVNWNVLIRMKQKFELLM